MGSSESWSWQTRTRLSMPLRPSTDSIATSTPICAVIWIIVPLPATRETDLSNPVQRSTSNESASCCQSRTRTRSHNRPPSPAPQRPTRRRPAWLPSFASPELRRAASSAPYSPAAADERLNTHRVAGPVPPQPATASPAASSDGAGHCETHPTAVVVARSDQEWAMCSCCSISADLGD
jgi:hypothetical protein